MTPSDSFDLASKIEEAVQPLRNEIELLKKQTKQLLTSNQSLQQRISKLERNQHHQQNSMY